MMNWMPMGKHEYYTQRLILKLFPHLSCICSYIRPGIGDSGDRLVCRSFFFHLPSRNDTVDESSDVLINAYFLQWNTKI
jgi:hypothetical protein